MSQIVETLKVEPSNEDTVDCLFFLNDSDKYSLDDFCKLINRSIKTLSDEYVWHRDALMVYIPILEERFCNELPHLASTTCFGDNLEDEWFIVYIVREITKQYPNLIVQMKDNDGDFLLIEAADHLPPWFNPDTGDNRIFIHQGKFHLIPPNIADIDKKLDIKDALQHITQNTELTIAPADVDNAINNRIGNYPHKIKENIHNAIVELPVELAALLQLNPNLIAPFVNTYCHRDMLDEKFCKNITLNNTVVAKVKFSKCLYAMLLHSKLSKQIKVSDNKRRILGSKIACGYQILMNKAADIYASKEYQKFIESLKNNGYFKKNIEGSQEYQNLMQQAKEYFSAIECPINTNVSNSILKTIETEEYLNTVESLQNEKIDDLEEDNEGWLSIHPDELNEFLNSRYGKMTKFKNNEEITPQNITTELSDFLKRSSDFEGIESYENEKVNHIEFEPDQFVNCVEKMLKLLSYDENVNIEEGFSDVSMTDSDDDSAQETEIDQELKTKLHGRIDANNKTVYDNLKTSIKEEKASSGPSSNLLRSMGLQKTDFIDSDDD